MNERNIRLLIAYDGTDFAGWQIQKNRRTVQALIEAALETMHRERRALTASGRTDAGVHAAGQTANFHTDIANMEGRRFVPALNSLLPKDVRVLDAAETSLDFHARFDARSRTYRYHIIAGRAALPHERRYALQLWRRPDINRLNEYARRLRGEMDCSVFASPKDPSKSRTRYIYGASFFVEGDTLVFEISANAFLWRMVRSVAGTLLHYEQKGLSAASFGDILNSGDRSLAGPTVPPEGLFLWKVEYYRGCV
ncbi:MAG: tRNA pseudouridine(38-40) synthase TruA [Spirochaetaceae bacterium]|jgi:tRNA pseudouridine38-40 synthase|nr:tRNA pseudouridine(38-40) synthase TruA [Spirochaetaceae bacterium]